MSYKRWLSFGPHMLFWSILAILNLPNFLWLSPNGVAWLDGAQFIESLMPCLLIGACFLALFARPWRAWLCLWITCLWWQPLAIGVRAINGTTINATLAGMAFSTSPAELWGLLSVIPVGWFVLFGLWNLACAYALYRLSRCRQWRWGRSFRGKIVLFCACMWALPYLVLPRVHEPDNGWRDVVNTDSSPLRAFRDADQSTGITALLPDAFPYELPKAVAQYWHARQVVDAVSARIQAPDPLETLTETQAKAEVVVLVIGESSTRNAWHWFNADAPRTTPKLEARVANGDSLWGYTQTLAQTTSTRQAVPSMLTSQPLVWPSGQANPGATRSIVSVAAQAGYATAWFSNQAAIGEHDGIIASYAKEAAATAFLNPSGFAQQGSLDGILLPAFRRYLSENARAFIVLHTLGSHFNYAHRYPSGFGPFPVSKNGREAYFNSVAYTDWLLDQLMDILASDGRKAVLVYSSDHGEAVPGGACNAESASRTTRDAYEIPALVWLSGTYAHAYPVISRQLQANQSEPYTPAAVHQTLLDLMRADTNQRVVNDRVQSFARSPSSSGRNGAGQEADWAAKLKSAVEKNPCFRSLQ